MKAIVIGGVFESEEQFNAYMKWCKENNISRDQSFDDDNIAKFKAIKTKN